MAIYRGAGGASDATNDATISEVQSLVAEAEAAALEATTAADEAAATVATVRGYSSSAFNSKNTATVAADQAHSSAVLAATKVTLAENQVDLAEEAVALAQTYRNQAQSSASAAANSANTALSYKDSAETAAFNATTQNSNASSEAATAVTKAAEAASSASAASTSASNAAASEDAAAVSEVNAASSESSALSAKVAAESARDAALAAYDSFDDRYLGAKSSDPTTDNDGNPLVAGALYFDTSLPGMKLYTGTGWVAAYISGGSGMLLQANNLGDVQSVSSSRTNLGVTATGADTTYAYRSNNLSDLASASTARTNLGATSTGSSLFTAASATAAKTTLGLENVTNQSKATMFTTPTFTGLVTCTDSLQIDGNLTVSGTTVTINATNLAVEDNMIYLNAGSEVSNPDLGFSGNYNDGTYRHAGVFRDATDGAWKFFKNYTPEPDASPYIDTSHASFALADVQANSFTGSLVGNASTVTNGVYTSGSYSNPSWITSLAETKVLPTQTSQSGKYLTTNGTSTSWASVPAGYTNADARAAISAGTGISYSSSTGVIASTITQYTNADARGALSAGTGISYNSSTGVITSTITQYTNSNARAALSFSAGSGAYNSTTGVITIPTNTNQLTNGAGFITGSSNTTGSSGSIAVSGGWSVTPSGTTLFFSYNGTNRAKLDSSGNLTVSGNVTAYGAV
jgi:hypothetical protein